MAGFEAPTDILVEFYDTVCYLFHQQRSYVLNRPRAVKMSLFIIRDFVGMREQQARDAAILYASSARALGVSKRPPQIFFFWPLRNHSTHLKKSFVQSSFSIFDTG